VRSCSQDGEHKAGIVVVSPPPHTHTLLPSLIDELVVFLVRRQLVALVTAGEKRQKEATRSEA